MKCFSVLLAMMLNLIFTKPLQAQSDGDSRTIANGDWNSPIWEVWHTGTGWTVANAPGSGIITVTNDVTISGTPTISGEAHFIAGTIAILNTGSLTNSGQTYIEGSTIVNDGNFTNSGTLFLNCGLPITTSPNSGSTFSSHTGTIEFYGDIYNHWPQVTWNTTDPGTMHVHVPSEIWGTIEGQQNIVIDPGQSLRIGASGTLAGSISVPSTSTFQLTSPSLELGTITWSGSGYLRLEGTIIVSSGTSPASGGTIFFGGTKWGAGTLDLDATDHIDWNFGNVAEGKMRIMGICYASVAQNHGIVENHSVTTYQGAGFWGGGTFINYVTFNIDCPSGSISQIIENYGTINRTQSGLVYLALELNNISTSLLDNSTVATLNLYDGDLELDGGGTSNGTFNVASGKNLTIAYGAYTVNAPGTVSGDGKLTLYATTLTANADINVAQFNGAFSTLAGSGTKTILSEITTTGLTNEGTGYLILAANASGDFSGTNKGTFVNNGILLSYIAGAGTNPDDPTLFRNNGLCILPQVDYFYGGVTCTQNVENFGTMIRSGATEYRFNDGSFPLHFSNAGRILVLSGCGFAINVSFPSGNRGDSQNSLGGSIYVSSGAQFKCPGLLSFSGDTLDNSGTVNCNPFSFTRSSPPQILTGGGNITSMAVNGGNVQLIGSQTVNLTLGSGKIQLQDADFNIGAGSLTGWNDSSYIATNGTGRLIRTVGTSPVDFPIGTSTSFNPVTIKTQTGSDNFGARVAQGIIPSVADSSTAVQRTWSLSEETPGDNGPIVFTAQWNYGEQGATFERSAARGWRNAGGTWSMQLPPTNITPGTSYPAVATIATDSLGSWAIANVDPVPSFAASTLAFGNVVVNSIRQDSVTLRNNSGWTTMVVDSVKSNNSRFSVTPTSASLPPLDSAKFYVTFNPTSLGEQSGVITFYSIRFPAPDTVHVNGIGSLTTVSVPLTSGWNIVSNPVTRDAGTDSVRQLFPMAMSDHAFSFEPGSGYQAQYTLVNRRGFWVKDAAQDTSQVVGFPRTVDSISVVPGWNLVGSITYAIDTALVVSDPPGIRSSHWFGYAGGYVASSSLLPGQGYWIKALAAGKFIFDASLVAPMRPRVSESNPLASADEFILSEKAGAKQTLFIEKEVSPAGVVSELPPQGPEGTFDVRFSSQKSIESVKGSGTQTISIRSSSFPVTFKWNLKDADGGYVVTDGVNGTLLPPKHISGKGELVITDPAIVQLVLTKEQGTPHEFVLQQNYPNPFNPTTQIKFSVANAGRATVEMFNVLGQKVGTLFNDNAEPGRYYTLNVNGPNMANGVYFYRLQSGARLDTRKMLLLK